MIDFFLIFYLLFNFFFNFFLFFFVSKYNIYSSRLLPAGKTQSFISWLTHDHGIRQIDQLGLRNLLVSSQLLLLLQCQLSPTEIVLQCQKAVFDYRHQKDWGLWCDCTCKSRQLWWLLQIASQNFVAVSPKEVVGRSLWKTSTTVSKRYQN